MGLRLNAVIISWKTTSLVLVRNFAIIVNAKFAIIIKFDIICYINLLRKQNYTEIPH